jgi:hypothetical protein
MKKGSYSIPESFAREIEKENEQRRAKDVALRYLTDRGQNAKPHGKQPAQKRIFGRCG